MRLVTKILLLSLALGLFTAAACASDVPVGFVSYDFIGGGLTPNEIKENTKLALLDH